VPLVGSFRKGCVIAALLAVCVCVSATPALGRQQFRARIKGAMGIMPLRGHADLAAGPSIPVVYHGGTVMRGVQIHTIFWAPRGFQFSGSPGDGILGYKAMIQRFLADVAHDSGTTANGFGVLSEYPERGGAGLYNVSYDAASDSIDDSDPYPPQSKQCPSPAGIATCVTDLQLRQEIDKVIRAHDPSARGLHDLWFIFLPPNVDTCIAIGSCGTTAFAGYHGLAASGRTPTIYAAIPDPLIEFTPPPGQDPQGNPEAEVTIDTVAHEAVEAITNPVGAGWMDPNGFEVADKCELPVIGTPLGYAPDGSPFNQLINGRQYLIQAMWSNVVRGCVLTGRGAGAGLPPETINLRQFSSSVWGRAGLRKAGIDVLVGLARGGRLVAVGQGVTRASGSWGPVSLLSLSGAHGVGDDRDEIAVLYRSKEIKPTLIATGDGGDPFTESGWTGWFVLDHGYAVGSRSVSLAPCFQTGVLTLTVRGVPTSPPVEECDTESDVATVATGRLTSGTKLALSSEDNRAVARDNRPGALVRMTIPLGEPRSVSSVANPQVLFKPTGFPTCTADLRAQTARCAGLVPGAGYTLTRARGGTSARSRADKHGKATFAQLAGAPAIRGGEVLTLTNRAGRVLTVLHVAHLRVDIRGQQTVIASGTCQPDDYYGEPVTTIPSSLSLGVGVAGSGTVCPANGSAAGLSTATIAQTDDRSGGLTVTEVPNIVRTTPLDGETLYGSFIALAKSGLPGPHGAVNPTGASVSLTIARAGHRIFHARNVNTARGVVVGPLSPGAYTASWVLTDANLDTRTLSTQFVEAP
jgi:hypothetical protein